MLTYPKNLEGSITIIGEKGTVRIGGVAVNEIQHWEFAEPRSGRRQRSRTRATQTTSVYGFGHPLYYDNVIKVLRGEAEPETDGREGLKSLEVLIATYLLGARRPARLAAAGVLRHGRWRAYWAHETAIVDAGAQIGDGTRDLALGARLRRRAHRRAAARSARTSSSATDVVIGNNVKIQNNVSVYDDVTLEDDVFCGPSMVFTNVFNPRADVVAQGRVPRRRSCGAARRSAPTARSSAASRSATTPSSAPARWSTAMCPTTR